ncbi:hypothetical protein FNV43_RR02362 [Rhamnella rubrinervis]|uniref:Uncharacterized protein n=1 Tax=Rhamnella rubrinervis TaxID=2594499 RepID=A0A8K0HSI8_9ROSA|nr:hypothetical protein FNV43_RR02362 [Rhamnella rubrinervis]
MTSPEFVEEMPMRIRNKMVIEKRGSVAETTEVPNFIFLAVGEEDLGGSHEVELCISDPLEKTDEEILEPSLFEQNMGHHLQ